MKMEEMRTYLESGGFNVVYKYRCDDGSYDFVISKNNHKHHDVYKWPDSQKSFMDKMISDFEKRFSEEPIRSEELMQMWHTMNPYISTCLPKIKDVVFNEPATIVFWSDGSKTVVKAQNDDIFDPEKA